MTESTGNVGPITLPHCSKESSFWGRVSGHVKNRRLDSQGDKLVSIRFAVPSQFNQLRLFSHLLSLRFALDIGDVIL